MDFSFVSARQNTHLVQHGPPYASPTAALGGLPNVRLDVPLTSVYLVLFALGGIGHMSIFQINRKHGHNFPMSGAMFGFCMARITACTMRIVWAARPQNVSVGIAASLFVSIGDIVGFVINLNLAQRIIRALHPRFGWHSNFKINYIVMYCLLGLSIVLLVSFTVWSFFILDPAKFKVARDVDLFGGTYFATAAFLPIPMVLCALAAPRTTENTENFGIGSLRSKVLIVLYGATLLSLGAWFRAGTTYKNARPINDPAPYQSKTCFYVFYFTLEILVIWTYLIVRIDRRFHVPDGSKRPGDYSRSMSKDNDMEHTIEMETTPDEPAIEGERTGIERETASMEHALKVEDASQVHTLSEATEQDV